MSHGHHEAKKQEFPASGPLPDIQVSRPWQSCPVPPPMTPTPDAQSKQGLLTQAWRTCLALGLTPSALPQMCPTLSGLRTFAQLLFLLSAPTLQVSVFQDSLDCERLRSGIIHSFTEQTFLGLLLGPGTMLDTRARAEWTWHHLPPRHTVSALGVLDERTHCLH